MLKNAEPNIDTKPRTLLPPLSATKVATLLLLADTTAILASGYFAYDAIVVYSLSQNLYVAAVVFIWLTTLFLMNFGDLYRYQAATHPQQNILTIILVLSTSFLFLLAAAFSIKISETFSRLWLGYFVALSGGTLILFRLAIGIALMRVLHIRGSKRNVAIVGSGEQSRRLTALLAQEPNRPYRIQGVYTDNLHPVLHPAKNGDLALPPDNNLSYLVAQARTGLIDDVVIAMPWHEDDRIMAVVSTLRELPVNVYLLSDLVGFRTEFRPPPSHFSTLPILQVVGKPMSGWDAGLKAMEDYALAPLILLAALPLLAAIAVAIKVDSPGPVFFRQKRLGFNNQIFDVYKFRTMRHEAAPQERTQQATADDQRITKLGRFLRRWSLDELPQIFNVLNGTMSLVGPRPHAMDHNQEFAHRAKGYFARHRVKPGITGLAQVKGYRGPTDTEEKLEGRVRNDIFYAENWTLSLDFQILLRTLIICVLGKNAY